MNVFLARDGKIILSRSPSAEWREFLTKDAPREISTALGMDVSPLLAHQNLVVTQEIKKPKDDESGYTEYGIGSASRESVSTGCIPWDFHLSVYNPSSYAHEFAHYLYFLSKLKNLYYYDSSMVGDLPLALERIIDAVSRQDIEAAEDDYLSRPSEWFARLFEVHISWRLRHVESRDDFTTTSPLEYWTSVYGSGNDIWHFVGYGHAFFWEYFQHRFHRSIRALLRDLIGFLDVGNE